METDEKKQNGNFAKGGHGAGTDAGQEHEDGTETEGGSDTETGENPQYKNTNKDEPMGTAGKLGTEITTPQHDTTRKP